MFYVYGIHEQNGGICLKIQGEAAGSVSRSAVEVALITNQGLLQFSGTVEKAVQRVTVKNRRVQENAEKTTAQDERKELLHLTH